MLRTSNLFTRNCWLGPWAGVAFVVGVTSLSVPVWADDNQRDDGNDTRVLVVDDDKHQCPTAQYTEIQAAVAAASSGATIHVCPGVYKTQVIITKPLNIIADNGSILQPTGPLVTTLDLYNSMFTLAPLLWVNNTRAVSIDGLTVDGTLASSNAVGKDYVGIYYQNASGSLTNMAVRNIKLPSAPGAQSGEAIFVQSRFDNHVAISDSSVHDYQKTGILIYGGGSDADVKHNYVTGIGSTPDIAQNGIQVSNGATASVTNNFVNNHIYAHCTAPTPAGCAAASANILISGSNGVSLRNNTVGTAQVGISVEGNGAQVQNNDVYDNKVFDGIDLFGSNNDAESNNVFHSDLVGILAVGNNNRISGNTINEATCGTGAEGGPNQVNGNKYHNVIMPLGTCDPPPNTTAVTMNAPTLTQRPRVAPR